jgi:hypothetical protein
MNDKMNAKEKRAQRACVATLLSHTDLALDLTWDDLLSLPAWAQMCFSFGKTQTQIQSADEFALWVGAVWHQPAIQCCIDSVALQCIEGFLMPGAASIILSMNAMGQKKELPPLSMLQGQFLMAGQFLMIQALPSAWKTPCTALWHFAENLPQATTVSEGSKNVSSALSICDAVMYVLQAKP